VADFTDDKPVEMELRTEVAKFRRLSIEAADRGDAERSDGFWKIADSIQREMKEMQK
jgi:hypothetical protein